MKKSKKRTKVVDVKKLQAHDVEEVKLPAANASAVKKGAAYHVLAGRPSKQAVVACFGKTGYALSWVTRAERFGINPELLCERFKTDPARVKADWAALAK